MLGHFDIRQTEKYAHLPGNSLRAPQSVTSFGANPAQLEDDNSKLAKITIPKERPGAYDND